MLADILSRNKNAISLGFCISFSLLCLLWQTNPFAQGLGFFGKMADRISSMLNSGLNFTGEFIADIDDYRELSRKYEQLKAQLETFRVEQDRFEQLRKQNEIYRKALDFPIQKEYPERKVEVMSVRLNAISPRMIIGKGRADGILPLMPVVARGNDADGNLIRALVGIVVSADDATAVVQPILHPSFRVGVRIVETGEWAILSGNSGRFGQVLLSYITSNFEPEQATFANESEALRPKFTIVTSGGAGLFPKGIPIGTVLEPGKRQNEFKTAYVVPFAQISTLDFVSVILKRPEPWSAQTKSRVKWEENLETEFGPPVYPELPKSAAQQSSRKTRQAQTAKSPALENKKTESNTTRSATRADGEQKPNKTTEKKRRIIIPQGVQP